MPDDEVIQPLKSVIRIATEQDQKTEEKTREKKRKHLRSVWRRSVNMVWT